MEFNRILVDRGTTQSLQTCISFLEKQVDQLRNEIWLPRLLNLPQTGELWKVNSGPTYFYQYVR